MTRISVASFIQITPPLSRLFTASRETDVRRPDDDRMTQCLLRGFCDGEDTK